MIKFEDFTIEGNKLSKDFPHTAICDPYGLKVDETERIICLIKARMEHCISELKKNLSNVYHADESFITWYNPTEGCGHFSPNTYNMMKEYLETKKLSSMIIFQAIKQMYYDRHNQQASDYDAEHLFNTLMDLMALAQNYEVNGREFKYPEK